MNSLNNDYLRLIIHDCAPKSTWVCITFGRNLFSPPVVISNQPNINNYLKSYQFTTSHCQHVSKPQKPLTKLNILDHAMTNLMHLKNKFLKLSLFYTPKSIQNQV